MPFDFETVQNLMLRMSVQRQSRKRSICFQVLCSAATASARWWENMPSGGRKYHYLVYTNKAGKGYTAYIQRGQAEGYRSVVNDHIELIAQVEQVLDYIASLPEQERVYQL